MSAKTLYLRRINRLSTADRNRVERFALGPAADRIAIKVRAPGKGYGYHQLSVKVFATAEGAANWVAEHRDWMTVI